MSLVTASGRALVERLFLDHGRNIRALFNRRQALRPDAAELAQEVYARFLRIGDLEAVRDPQAYLFAIAHNLAREHATRLRLRGVQVDVQEEQLPADHVELPIDTAQMDRSVRIARLREVLGELSPKARAAVVMHYWKDMTYPQIAQELGISTPMVKKYVSRTIALCRRRMSRLQ
jgi:RNA polymerase sigma factor (sigma-70 family)